MTLAHRTLLNAAYDELRTAVLDGSLAPGSRVTVRPLAEKLGLSPTPIKGALAGLEREGFLVAVPHRGYFVPEFDTDDLLELYELREAVDGLAARRAATARNRTDATGELATLIEKQRAVVASGNLQAYSELDLQFHRLIWHAAGSRRLLPIAENLIAQVRLGNRLSAQAPGRLPSALVEHEAILRALEKGDPRAAERVVRRHVRESGKALREYLALRPANNNSRRRIVDAEADHSLD